MGRWKDNTQGETVPWWRAEGPHSAVHTSTTPENELYTSARARTRAGAREGSDPTAHPQVHSAAPPAATESHDTGAGEAAGGASEVVSPIVEATRGWRVPAAPAWTRGLAAPDWWAQQPPSLSKIWAFASRGEWTSPTGLPRVAGRAYAYMAIPVISVLHSAAWITAWGGSRLWQAPEIEPGDLVSDDMPALAAIWQAITGTQTTQPATQPGGLSRVGVAYAIAAVLLMSVCYAAGWTVERFSRLVVVASVPGVALGFIPLPWN